MRFTFIPYTVPLMVSSILSFALAGYGLAHRRTLGAKELTVSSLICAIWAAGNALEFAGADLPTMLFWANVQYFAYAFSPLCWFTLVFRFNGKEKYVTTRNIILLSILPAATTILVWFDPLIGFVRHSFSRQVEGSIPYIVKTYGPWFWVHYGYCYMLNFSVLGFLIAAVRKKGSVFRYQSIYLLVCFAMVLAANLSYVLGFTPVKHHDMAPIVFGLSSIILWRGIFRHRIFRIPPIARSRVFELMANGILVVDERWNLVDSNESARRMLGLQSPSHIGKSLRDTLPPLARVTAAALDAGESQDDRDSLRREIMLERPSGQRFFELDASRLLDPRYGKAWVIIATDVTDLKRAREQIIRQREELAAAAERDRLSMELHDTLGQVLSFAVIQTDTVLREMGRGNRDLAVSLSGRLREILKGTHEDLRGFVRGLRAAEYESISFGTLLIKEADRFHGSSRAQVSVSSSPKDVDFSPYQKLHLAGIVREALNNIAKHARATKVAIEFSERPGENRLVIEDDGAGLPTGGETMAEGSGMGIMRERAECLNGTLRLYSRAEGGTRVVLSFPGAPENADGDPDR